MLDLQPTATRPTAPARWMSPVDPELAVAQGIEHLAGLEPRPRCAHRPGRCPVDPEWLPRALPQRAREPRPVHPRCTPLGSRIARLRELQPVFCVIVRRQMRYDRQPQRIHGRLRIDWLRWIDWLRIDGRLRRIDWLRCGGRGWCCLQASPRNCRAAIQQQQPQPKLLEYCCRSRAGIVRQQFSSNNRNRSYPSKYLPLF